MKPTLQIDADMFREWLLMYFDRMRDMEKEVLIYRGAIEIVKKHVPLETSQTIEKIVEGLRPHHSIEEVLNEKYAKYRAQALECISQGSQDQALAQYLREWKAEGPIN